MNLKKPLSYKEQVQQLIAHGFIVNNITFAEDFLSKVNYYRLTGYALQYRKSPHDSDLSQPVQFEHIVMLHEYDCKVRNLFQKYIEIIEIFYRTRISYYFSMEKCRQAPHNQHYDLNNFYDKENAKEVFSNFSKKKFYHKETLFFQHHKNNYNSRFPLWVITEMLTFSDLSKLYSCMYISEQRKIAKSVGTGNSVLKNHLHCLVVLRNKCAHASRLINCNFKPPAKFSDGFLRTHPEIKVDSLFSYVLVLLKRLPTDELKHEFINDLSDLIKNYSADLDLSLINFPDDYEIVMKKNMN